VEAQSITDTVVHFQSGDFKPVRNFKEVSATADQYTISIYDTKGASVFKKAYSISGRYQLLDVDLRAAANGVYLIRLTGKNNRVIATGKVIVAH
jgi:hypothetical protein